MGGGRGRARRAPRPTMTQNKSPVRERQAMLAGMTPVLMDGTYFFCSTNDAEIIAAAATGSLATRCCRGRRLK